MQESVNISKTAQKESLTRKITHMKNEIQYIIDKKKKLDKKTQVEKIAELNLEKDEKIKELELLSQRLTDLTKIEKMEQRKKMHMSSIARKLDNLEYQCAVRKDSHQAIESAKKAKEARDIARKTYNEYLEYESKYKLYDPEEVPSYLFLYNHIIEKYGLCPYINIKMEDNIDIDNLSESDKLTINNTKNNILKNRIQWLEQFDDKGKILYELKSKVIDKTDLKKAIVLSESVQNKINIMIETLFVKEQMELWNNCLDFVNEYMNCPIKTKKIKEKFKHLINDMSILYNDSNLPINDYLNVKYKTAIFVVNKLVNHKSNYKPIDEVHIETFANEVLTLKESMMEIDNQNRYINNTLQILKNELYLFLTKQKNFNTTVNINEEGKYFKKWSALTNNEKLERFKSYAEHYIEKYMVAQGILKSENKIDTVNKVYNLISEAYNNKIMSFRDFKWDIKRGVVEYIKIIKYDKEKGEFYLTKTTCEKKSVDKDNKRSRKNVQRTILTKENEKLINEFILLYIVNNSKNKENLSNETCLEELKEKLSIKKLTINDKNLIFDRYNSILDIIQKNSSEH
jgi:hypothetical protein